MNIISKIKNIPTLRSTFAALVLLSAASCTDLNEDVIDEVLGSGQTSPENSLATIYGQMANSTFVDHGNVFGLQEYSTDEALLPTRGSDWGDGGKWRAIHEFTWAPDNAVVTTTWDNLNSGITKSIVAISAIEERDFADKALFLAEAKCMLAFYTYHTLDLFGQAPYRDPSVKNAPLEIRKAESAIDPLIQEVEDLLPSLATLGEKSTHNGRFTKEAAHALLADMYLNRAVLKDRYASSFNFSEQAPSGSGTDMDKVIEHTSALISNSRFKLEENYFHNFDIDNDNGTELVFVVKQDINTLRSSDNDFAYMPMERNQKPSPENRGTNATCISLEFYQTWANNHDDPRFHRHYQYADGTWFMNNGTDVSVPASSIVPNSENSLWFHFNRGILAGQQYGPTILANKDFERTADGRIKVNKLFCEKNTTLLMDFTPELNFDNPRQAVFSQGQINRGARVFKYEFDPEKDNGSSHVDIPLYRLGGLYCMRAEAYFRKGNTQAALADLNILRTSRKREALFNNAAGKTISVINETVLLNETGFELYWEMYRRKALVRFGKFNDGGGVRPKTEAFRRIYPIPQTTIDASDAFEQNQGY